jgi:putative lipoprotein
MHVTSPRVPALGLLLVVAAVGCPKPAPQPSSQPSPQASPPTSPQASTLAGAWTLFELNGQLAPTGAGGRRVTLRFEADSKRVSGFAGCNRLTAGTTIVGDSLQITAAATTMMACTEGMELERKFTDALNSTTGFHVSGDQLTLLGASGPVASFSRGAP